MKRRGVAGFKALLTCLLGLSFSVVANGQQLAWSSGFENGFPGEWLNYSEGTYSANGSMPAGSTSAWTIVSGENGVVPPQGSRMYKGWITGTSATDVHRAYPVVHLDAPTPLINTFMVYLDVDYSRMSADQWVQLGTWGNAQQWALATMSVRDRKLRFAHTNPFEGEYIGPEPRPDFPVRRWVRMTVYLNFQGSTGTMQVWQDGVPMLRGGVAVLQQYPGRNLQRAHWGMYASGNVNHGVQYNDRNEICRLSAALTDLVREPTCSKTPRPPGNLRVE